MCWVFDPTGHLHTNPRGRFCPGSPAISDQPKRWTTPRGHQLLYAVAPFPETSDDRCNSSFGCFPVCFSACCCCCCCCCCCWNLAMVLLLNLWNLTLKQHHLLLLLRNIISTFSRWTRFVPPDRGIYLVGTTIPRRRVFPTRARKIQLEWFQSPYHTI